MFSVLMLFLCVIVHTMSSGKSLQLLCILPFGMLCLSVISMIFVGSVYVGGYGCRCKRFSGFVVVCCHVVCCC